MTWHEIELVWVEYLKTKDENIYKEYRKLAVEFVVKTWEKIMNNSNPPNPMECRYIANLHQLNEGEEIRVGDFFQTFLGNLSRVDSIDVGYKVGVNRLYYRVDALQMIDDAHRAPKSVGDDFVYGWDEHP